MKGRVDILLPRSCGQGRRSSCAGLRRAAACPGDVASSGCSSSVAAAAAAAGRPLGLPSRPSSNAPPAASSEPGLVPGGDGASWAAPDMKMANWAAGRATQAASPFCEAERAGEPGCNGQSAAGVRSALLALTGARRAAAAFSASWVCAFHHVLAVDGFILLSAGLMKCTGVCHT